jgi:hypothetical protein
MFERLKSKTGVALVASLVAALGVGGIAIAQNSGNSTPSPQAKSASEAADEQSGAPDNSAADSDAVQSGNETSDQGGEESNDQPGDDGAGEQADQPAGHADQEQGEDQGSDQGEQ